MGKSAFIILLTHGFATPAFAQSASLPAAVPDTSAAIRSPAIRAAAELKNVAGDCPVDSELNPEQVELPACAVQEQRGQLRIKAAYVAVLSFYSFNYGLAAARLPGIGWTYVNRNGRVVVRNVADASLFHHGLVRVTRGGKWGLADAQGRLVVPLRYDGILEPQIGLLETEAGWLACEQCRNVSDSDGNSWLEGGQWLRLNARGKVAGSALGAAVGPDGTACPVDPEVLGLPPCAVREQNGRLRVTAVYAAMFSFDRHGLAAVPLDGIGFTYINRHGWVVVRDVAVFDMGPSPFHHGLVRVTRGGKWGLADTRGQLVVPLLYDGISEYDPQTGWVACKQCHKVDKGEGHWWWEGGQWVTLNTRGKVIDPASSL